MRAVSLFNQRIIISENTFAELVVWNIPKPAKSSTHSYKYRIALIVDRECVLRYDNEPGKSDHKHVGDKEIDYNFTTPEKLIEDFWKDAEQII